MTRVFLGGSRKVSRLNESIRARLGEIVRRKLQIVIGDANGADRAMQRQLAEWDYRDVVVYFVGSAPRNNEGGWPMQHVPTPPSVRGFDFYSVKDRAMAEAAECGLMLWDGVSRGTLANVETLAGAGKPVAVYVSPRQRFVNVLTPEDVKTLTGSLASHPEPEAQTAFALPASPPPAPARRKTA
jgi:adenine-specific DNA-methyltransferase